MDVVRAQPTEDGTQSRWGFVLYFLWASLAAWLTFAFARGETLRDDWVALPAVAFCVVSAVIGSRIYLYLQDRRHERAVEVEREAALAAG